MPVAIPIIAGAVMSGISGYAATASIAGALAFAAIGAGLGALSILTQQRPGSVRSNGGEISVTTSIRNVPVPIVFGKARMGGNYLQLGKFYTIKDNHSSTVGRRLQVMHAVVGICEGPCKSITNVYLDGKTLAEQARAEKLPERYYVRASLGEPDEAMPPELLAQGTIPQPPKLVILDDGTRVYQPQPPILLGPVY